MLGSMLYPTQEFLLCAVYAVLVKNDAVLMNLTLIYCISFLIKKIKNSNASRHASMAIDKRKYLRKKGDISTKNGNGSGTGFNECHCRFLTFHKLSAKS